ncbi:MAG: hypothetical protein ACREIU_03300 [Planctomycetota bacterium]
MTVRTDGGGKFEAKFETGGVVQVRTTAPRYKSDTQTKVLPPPPYHESFSIRLGLEESEFIWIRGRVLDLEGEALASEDLHFLFPNVDDDPRSLEPFDTVSWIHALAGSGHLAREIRQSAGIPGDAGGFGIRVRRGWRGAVVLLFRDRILQSNPWADGDPEVVFRVDVSALRSGLGALEVKVLDGETGASVPNAKVQVERERFFRGEATDRVFRLSEGERIRVPDIPPGPLALRVSARGYAMATAGAEIATGATTQVEFRLRRPATLRVRLVPAEGWLPEPDSANVEFYDREGRWIDFSSTVVEEGADRWVRLEGVPPGEGFVVVSDNALPVRMSSGSNPDLDLPVRRPRKTVVRYRVPRGSPDVGAPSSAGGYRVLLAGRVPIRDWTSDAPEDSSGWSGWGDSFPPGSYTIEIDPGAGAIVRREFEVGEGEETTVVVDG